MTKKALDMFRLAIPEKDARIKLMMFWASCLDGWAKDPELAILTGVGGNAKTTTVQCINKVFGEYGLSYECSTSYKDAASADKPNSQIAAMEAARMVMMEETNRDEAFNPSMVKKLVNPGDISNRDLHAKQKTFKITSKITLITNHKPKMDIKDGGLKRRLFHYRYKCRFVHNPEPNSYQRKDDPRFIKEYPDNPEFQKWSLSVYLYTSMKSYRLSMKAILRKYQVPQLIARLKSSSMNTIILENSLRKKLYIVQMQELSTH